MTTPIKHTPTPWRLYRPVHRAVVVIQGPDYQTVAEVPTLTGKEIDLVPAEIQLKKENAAIIVRAVNFHERMVGLLKKYAELTYGPLRDLQDTEVSHLSFEVGKCIGDLAREPHP